MLTSKSPRSVLVVGFTAALSLAAVAALLGTRSDRPADTLSDLMRKDGFDFTELRAPSKPWRGPELGEKIDLSRLKMADGRTLAGVVAEGPAMLVAVDPSCRMCRTAADTMQEVGARLSALGVPYHVVAFVPVGENFHAYAESLGAGRLSFVWSQHGEAPLRSSTPSSPRTSSSPATARCSAFGPARTTRSLSVTGWAPRPSPTQM